MYIKVILVGDLGKDPEMRYATNGQAFTSFSVAVDDSYTDKNSGQRVKRTMWTKITAWGKQAETCNQYLKKGSRVLVEGHLNTRYNQGEDQCNGPQVWQDKSGDYRANFEISAEVVRFLDKLQGGGSSGGGGSSYAQSQPQTQSAPDPDPASGIPF
jgi:single-strand DNA-binding protein